MLRVKSVRQGLLWFGFAALLLAGTADAADPSAPASAPDASAPAAQPGSVQAVMAMAAKVAQEQAADKKKKDEEERLRGFGADWESWTPENSVADTASLERGARDFAGYCRGCHSLKYMRYSRLAQDLQIPADQLQQYVLPAGAKAGKVHLLVAGRDMPLVQVGARLTVAVPSIRDHEVVAIDFT